MELIINIPEEAYNACLKLKSNDDEGILGFCLINATANGTLLKEKLKAIKAEIEKLEYDDFDCNLVLPAWKVYDIIDSYIEKIKGERTNETSEWLDSKT